jgi:hypothetical protein
MSFNLPIAADKATHIVVYHADPPAASSDSGLLSELRKQIYNLTAELNALSKRVLHIELAAETEKPEPLPRKSPFFAAAVAPEPSGLEVRRLSEAVPVDTSDSKTAFATIVNTLPAAEDVPEPEVEELVEEEVEGEAEGEEVEGEEVEGEEEEEEVEEEQEEAEGVAMEEFEYKGVTYYRDAENQVYQLDEDGDLDDTPIGVWNETKQKVIKYAKV